MKKKIENRWTITEKNIEIIKAEADEINTAVIFTAECEKSRTKAKARRRKKLKTRNKEKKITRLKKNYQSIIRKKEKLKTEKSTKIE